MSNVNFEVGDIVSEIENHIDPTKNSDSIHIITFVRPFPHGNYNEIGLSGYTDEDRETEKFSEFQVYHLPDTVNLSTLDFTTLPNLN